MALVKCPECGKEISDNSKKCIHCGSPIKKKKEPINIKKIIIIIVTLLLIISIIVGIVLKNNNDKKQKEIEEKERIEEEKRKAENEYYQNMENAISLMLDGGAKGEKAGDLTYNVWYNSIWKEKDDETNKYTMTNGKFNDDFNTSLSNLFKDQSYIDIINEVEKNRDEVKVIMEKLKNPPIKYTDKYEDIKEFYDSYSTFINLVINPTGSLTTYSTNYNNAKSDFLKQYNKISE